MSDPQAEQLVRAFFEAYGTTHTEVRAAFEHYLADSCRWSNPGMPTCEGKAAIIELLNTSHDTMHLEGTPVDVLHVASNNDGVVFTERVDHLIGDGGKVLLDLPVAGVLEVRDGKIVEWREYADSALFASLLAMG